MTSPRCTFTLLFLFLALLSGCGKKASAPGAWEQVALQGTTMGTTYSIKVVVPQSTEVDAQSLQAKIDARLAEVNSLMSTYDPASELSRFNVSTATGPITLSSETYSVILAARDLYLSTEGAFDPTVGPLVDLWGFGPAAKRTEPPSPPEIASATEMIGMDRLVVEEGRPAIAKLKAGVHLDLSAIAKGYGVDAVSELLFAQGYKDHMVEIGGEIRVEGLNLKREHWNLGIDSPRQEPGRRNLVHTLHLTGQSVATSGNYRNFFEYDGIRYTHVMDPKSGWPVPDVVKSVTVIAPSCMRADGAATAIMVLGAEKGIAWAESEKDLEALVLSQTPEGEIIENRTPGFEKFIAQ